MDAALFVSGTVHARTVTLLDGSAHVLHFRELTRREFRAYYRGQEADDDDAKDAATAALLCASLCEPDGTPALDAERAGRLKPAVSSAIISAIMAVNGFSPAEKKALPDAASAGSGTS